MYLRCWLRTPSLCRSMQVETEKPENDSKRDLKVFLTKIRPRNIKFINTEIHGLNIFDSFGEY
jgi:hypothetical protein